MDKNRIRGGAEQGERATDREALQEGEPSGFRIWKVSDVRSREARQYDLQGEARKVLAAGNRIERIRNKQLQAARRDFHTCADLNYSNRLVRTLSRLRAVFTDAAFEPTPEGGTDLTDGRYDIVMDTPPGRLGIRLQDSRVVAIDYVTRRTRLSPLDSPFARRIAGAMDAWFRDASSPLDIPVSLVGTGFQRRVWAALRRIRQGEVTTYGELASRLGSGARAVGNACRRNPVPILVPCHRVVAASGTGGYGGRTGGVVLQRKLWLLRHEGCPWA